MCDKISQLAGLPVENDREKQETDCKIDILYL
jgi:hypothetical protein